jgi:hypothetical protein
MGVIQNEVRVESATDHGRQPIQALAVDHVAAAAQHLDDG